MTKDLKMFRIKKKGETDPCKFFALGRLESAEEAIKRLNRIFREGAISLDDFTERLSLILVEGYSPKTKEHNLKITGEGENRIAEIAGS